MPSRKAVLLVLPPPYGHEDYFKKGVKDLCANAVYNRPSHLTFQTHHVLIIVAGPATCAAAPVPNQACNYPAYGFETFLLSQAPGIPPLKCHEQCLANPICLSSQIEDSRPDGIQVCNLY